MMDNPRPIVLKPCPKGFTRDLDKAIGPEETLRKARAALANAGLDIYAGARRVDTGRLGIPVYMGICGQAARQLVPARKQMGKGASPQQARASALMEVMERYAFFSFWAREAHMPALRWREAEEMFDQNLIPLEQILTSVNDDLARDKAAAIMNLTRWRFYPATHLQSGRIVWLPLDWFRMLGEFNGSAAGNTMEEAILQAIAELVERHVCALADQRRETLPTIDQSSCDDAVLARLLAAFRRESINLVLKDMSQGMPMPVVGALAWDPSTFPRTSEIVFTAGAATSPARAAIRAVTEVAQLGGDFCTCSCYEASGLPKFENLADCAWLLEGPLKNLEELPDLANPDICREIHSSLAALSPVQFYAMDITNPALNIPAAYCIAPGLQFRERDRNQSLGLFVGRKIAEESPPDQAMAQLESLEQLLPGAFYLPFFRGIAALRAGDTQKARNYFEAARPLQPDSDSLAMASFYAGYASTLREEWQKAIPDLQNAAELCPGMKEYANLLGVSLYKTGAYAAAREWFDKALKIDKGSAIDWANRGLCNELLGNAGAAREDFERALGLDPAINFAAEHLAALEG